MIYEHQCESCGEITLDTCRMEDRKQVIPCSKCGGTAVRIISHTNFQLKGEGWSKDGYEKSNP